MFRFGLPTMPAELSLYSLNFIDRIILVRFAGLAEAGLYALAVKFAQGMQVLARGIQLAWPPLAYSIQDDEEARRAYAVIFTWFAALLAFGVIGLWLESRWIVRLLAAPDFFSSHRAVGLLATGIALYALYLAMVVILGRTGRTEFSFPATIAAVATNVALNLALVPSLDIVGAGLALVASYVVVLVLMYAFTQRLFPVPYEWRRLALVVLSAAALIGAGEALLPTSGFIGLASRTVLWLVYPAALLAMGFLHEEERSNLAAMLRPSAIAARARSLQAATAPDGAERAPATAPGSAPRSTRPPPATRTGAAPDRPRERVGRQVRSRDRRPGRRPPRLGGTQVGRCRPPRPRASPRRGWGGGRCGRGASTSRRSCPGMNIAATARGTYDHAHRRRAANGRPGASDACACTSRGRGGTERRAGHLPSGRSRAARGGSPGRPGRGGCASRRRAAASGSPPLRSRRRSRDPGKPTSSAASRRTSIAADWTHPTVAPRHRRGGCRCPG